MTALRCRSFVAGLFVLTVCLTVGGVCQAETKSTRVSRARQKLDPQLQQNLDKLKSDLQSVHGKSQVTKEQKQAISKSLTAILAVANKPSQESVQTLANDLTKFLADKKLGAAEVLTLTKDIATLLSSANISQEDALQLKADVQVVLKATNLTQADIKMLQQDIQAVVEVAQAKRPAAK